MTSTTKDEVLSFWFEEAGPDDWFARNDAFDDRIRKRFAGAAADAAAGKYDAWADEPLGALALCILLDQFPRNLHRGSPRAFAADGKALAVSRAAVERGFDRDPALGPMHRAFLYMPFMHSEVLADQERCLTLMRERVGNHGNVEAAERHLEIIARFGRFPHRNAVLGRKSTDEEVAFLKEPRSSF